MRRSIVVFLLLAALLVALPSFATEPNPSARQRELIQQLLELSDANAAGPQLMDAFFGQIEKQLVAEMEAKGEDAADAKELFGSFRQRAAKLDFNALIGEAQIHIYAKYFDEKELEDLIAFYSTPTGRKSIEVMPHLLREGMEVGVQYVSPKIEEAMLAAREDFEQKRPWRRTMSDMRSLHSAIADYAADHDDHYPMGDFAGLESVLEDYLDKFPAKDIWGHAYAYVVSDDATHFRLVSSGADGNFEWDSRRIGDDLKVRYRDRLEDDVIFQDGQFTQLPVQAKPKE